MESTPEQKNIHPNVAARFSWVVLEDKCILDIDVSHSVEEECIAAAHAIRYFGANPPKRLPLYLMINGYKSGLTLKAIRIAVDQARKGRIFEMTVAYGSTSKIMHIGTRMVGYLYPTGSRLFKTRDEALAYLRAITP